MTSLDLFKPSPCNCGDTPMICEDADEVRIVSWCFCPVEEMILAKGKTLVEAREDWEMRVAGSRALAEASPLGEK